MFNNALPQLIGSSPRYNFVLDGSENLLPCPFCGSTNLELANTHTPSYWIECLDCDCKLSGGCGPDLAGDAATLKAQHKASAEDAITKWNTRVKSSNCK